MGMDRYGLTVSSQVSEAIAALDQFITEALSYGSAAEACIQRAVSADPSWGLAHAYAAGYYLSQETFAYQNQIKTHLRAAKTHLVQANHRERLYIHGIMAWAQGNIEAAVQIHEEIAQVYPQDLISVQQGQYHYFYQGNSKKLLRIAEKVLPANPVDPYLLGMIAFGLEQCQALEAAEIIGRRAVTLNPEDAWAQHAIAHVLDTQGRFREGITWLEEFSPTWNRCNSLLYTHNWWHLGLFYLASQDYDRVRTIYDQHIWGRAVKPSPKDQVGAISLLLHLELEPNLTSHSQWQSFLEQRWQDISPYLELRLHEHHLPFQDLHYVYALVRAGCDRWCEQMLQSMVAHAQSLESLEQRRWQDIVLPAAHGLVAYAMADWQKAVLYLQPIMDKLPQVGGSDTQQKLFQKLYRRAIAQTEKQPRFFSTQVGGDRGLSQAA